MQSSLDSSTHYGIYRRPPEILSRGDEICVVAGWIACEGTSKRSIHIIVNGHLTQPDYAFSVPMPIDGVSCFGVPLLPDRLHFLHLIRCDAILSDELVLGLRIDWPTQTQDIPISTSSIVNQPPTSPTIIAPKETIGIVLPLHASPLDLLRRQLLSIQHQSYTEWHTWVGIPKRDDGIANEVDAMLAGDTRFTLLRTESDTPYTHFEQLLSMAQNQCAKVALCDQDDYWHDNKLAQLSGAGTGVAYSDMRVVTASAEVMHTTVWHERTHYASDPLATSLSNVISGCSMMIDADMLDTILPFPRVVGHAMHDHWIAMVGACLGTLNYVDEPLMDYTQHANNAVGYRPMRKASRVRGALRQRSFHRTLRRLREGKLEQHDRFITTHLKNYFDHYLQRRIMYLTLKLRHPDLHHPRLEAIYSDHLPDGLVDYHRDAASRGWRTDHRPLSLYAAMHTMMELNLHPIEPLS